MDSKESRRVAIDASAGGEPIKPRHVSESVNLLTSVAALERKTQGMGLVSSAPARDQESQGHRVSASPEEAEHKTLYDRAFSPLTPGGVRQSTFTLVQTALGGGILALPYMIQLCGLGLGVALLTVCQIGTNKVGKICGAIAIVGMHVIMRSAVELRIYTFSGLLAACMGPKSGVFLDVSLFLYGTGSTITYFILLGDFIPAIYRITSQGEAADPQQLRTHSLLATLLVIIPLSLPKELSALRYVSPVAITGILYTTVIVVCHFPSHFALYDWSDEILCFNIDKNIFRCFSMCLFAYNCHINVVPVSGELVNPRESRVLKITTRVAALQFFLYVMISSGGYLSFLGRTPPNIITAYPDDDPWILVGRVMLSITMTVNIPLTLNPTVRSLLNLFELLLPSLREDAGPGGSGSDSDASGGGKLKPLLSDEGPATQRGTPAASRDRLRRVLAVACCFAQCSVAIKVSNVAVVIGILGATVSTLMMVVIPILLMNVACPGLYPPAARRCFTALLGAASAMSLATLLAQ